MTDRVQDPWARWVLERQFAHNPTRPDGTRAALEAVHPVRDRVLAGARVAGGEVVLDVGCGSGLIAFGALERVGASGRVLFSDVSQELLDHGRARAEEAGVLDRCDFLRAPADALSAVADASVDVITTRSVLIYVDDKRRAFAEFFRVLRPGGRLSIFEPINRFGGPHTPGTLFGYETTVVEELASRVRAGMPAYQPSARETDPMLNFDERDLLVLTEAAGFLEIHLDFEADVKPRAPLEWESFLRFTGRPGAPSIEECMRRALSAEEFDRLAAHLRPLVESGRGTPQRGAVAYLRAVKREEQPMGREGTWGTQRLEDPVLTTDRLILRDFAEGDLADLHAVRSDPEVARFMDFDAETLDQTRAWLDGAIAHARKRPRDGYNLAVVQRATGRVIGWVGFGESSRYPPGSGEHGVGYMLARAHWGRGYATEALRAVIAHSFDALGARRVSTWCWADNRASARVMAKAGMRLERRYERTEPKSGAPTPCLEYAVRVDEWRSGDGGPTDGPKPIAS